MKTSHKWFLLNSGGGAQAFDTPDLYYNNLFTDQVILNWSVGADSYVVDISDDALFSNIVGTYSGALTTKTFTGLSVNSLYYARVKAEFDSVWTDFKEVSFYTEIDSLVGAYYASGVADQTTNDYGTTIALQRIASLKSVINTAGPLLTTNVNVTNISSYLYYNRAYASATITPTANMTTTSALALGSGAFTICGRMQLSSTPGISAFLKDSVTGGNRLIRFDSGTVIRVAINNQFSSPMDGNIPIGTMFDLIIHCDGSLIKTSYDGGVTWTNSVARPKIGDPFNLDYFAGGLNFQYFRFYSKALTDAEISRVVNSYKTTPFINNGVSLSKTTKNLPAGFIADPVNNYIESFSAGYLTRGGLVTKTVWSTSTYDYFILVAPIASPNYGNTTLFARNRTTGKIHTGIDLGHYATTEDIHERPSLALINNTLWVTQMRNHYDYDPASLYVRKFWDGFNFKNYTTLPLAKGIGNGFCLNQHQYIQIVTIGNKIAALSHMRVLDGIRSNDKGRITCTISEDGGQSWGDQFAVFYADASNTFAYPVIIEDNNNGKCNLIIEYVVSGVSKGVVFFDTTDFITWSNKEGTYSKNVVSGGYLTTSEAFTNGTIIDARASTSTGWTQGLHTSDGLIYGVIPNAAATALQLYYQLDGSAKVLKTIDTGADTIVIAGTTSGSYVSAFHRSCYVAVYRGSGQFDVVALQVNSGNWTPTLYRTLDWGDTWGKVGVLPGIDLTKQHYEFEISHSYHANGDKGILMATKATSSDTGVAYILDVDEFDNI